MTIFYKKVSGDTKNKYPMIRFFMVLNKNIYNHLKNKCGNNSSGFFLLKVSRKVERKKPKP